MISVPSTQTKMNAYGMDSGYPGYGVKSTVQQTALFRAVHRNIDILIGNNWKLTQKCIAVMPLRVNRIAAVGVAAPHLVSEVFVMGSFGPPAGVTKGECLMGTENFLQKNHVGTYGAHGLSKLKIGRASCRERGEMWEERRQYSNR